MPFFNVSLLTNVEVSGAVQVPAPSAAAAEAAARLMHSRAQVPWAYRGQKIGAYTGPLDRVWALPSGEPGSWSVQLTARVRLSVVVRGVEAKDERAAVAKAEAADARSVLPWAFGDVAISQFSEGATNSWAVDAPPPPPPEPERIPTVSELEAVPSPNYVGLYEAFNVRVTATRGVPQGDALIVVVEEHVSPPPPAPPQPPPLPVAEPEPPVAASFADPVSCAYDPGDRDPNGAHVWVCGMGSPVLQKVQVALSDSTPVASPWVVREVDLSALWGGRAGLRPSAPVRAREVRAWGGYVFVSCHDSRLVLIVDPATDEVVGRCLLAKRARSVAFDGAGNFFAAGADINDLPGIPDVVYKFSVAGVIAAWPDFGTPSAEWPASVVYGESTVKPHVEEMTYGGGYLWFGTGSWQSGSYGGIVRVDPSTGAMEYHAFGGGHTGWLQMAVSFHGGFLWVTGKANPGNSYLGDYEMFVAQLDPGDLPNPVKYVGLGAAQTNGQGDQGLVSDGASMWAVGSADSNSFLGAAFAVDESTGSVSQTPTDFSDSLYGCCFDGTSVWAVVRSNGEGGPGPGLVRFNAASGEFDYRVESGLPPGRLALPRPAPGQGAPGPGPGSRARRLALEARRALRLPRFVAGMHMTPPYVLAQVTLDQDGRAQFMTADLEADTYTCVAQYLGAGLYDPSQSDPAVAVITEYPPGVRLSASPNPGVYGQPVFLRGTVHPGATGNVTFYRRNDRPGRGPGLEPAIVRLGDALLNVSGYAEFVTSALPTGRVVLVCFYEGDIDNPPATSEDLVYHVSTNGTETALRAAVNPIGMGDTLRLIAAVTPAVAGPPFPSGDVDFLLRPPSGPDVLMGTAAIGTGPASNEAELDIGPASTTSTASYNQPTTTIRRPRAITYDGTYVWSTDYDVPVLWKYDPLLPGQIGSVDLSSLAGPYNNFRRVRAFGGRVYAANVYANMVAVVDPSTSVEGGTPTGWVSVPGKARDVVADGDGNFYVNSIDSGTGDSTIYKYSLAAVEAAYPSAGTADASFPVSYTGGATEFHVEEMDFAGGFLWATTGYWAGYTMSGLVRIDPSTGAAQIFDMTADVGASKVWTVLQVNGQVWTVSNAIGGDNMAYRFDPATWPTVEARLSFQGFASWTETDYGSLSFDGTYVWYVGRNGRAARIDPVFSFVSMLTTGTFTNSEGSVGGQPGTVWITNQSSSPYGIFSMAGAPGAEAVTAAVHTAGAVVVQVVSTAGFIRGSEVVVHYYAGEGYSDTWYVVADVLDATHLLLSVEPHAGNAVSGTLIPSGSTVTQPVSLPVGTYDFLASYLGDGLFDPSTSGVLSVVVNPPVLDTYTTGSAYFDGFGRVVVQGYVQELLTANPVTAGTVTVSYDPGTGVIVLGPYALDAFGNFTSTDPQSLGPGDYYFTLDYSGSTTMLATYNPSSYNLHFVVPSPYATAHLLSYTLDQVCRTVTLHLRVTADSTYVGVPTGTIDVSVYDYSSATTIPCGTTPSLDGSGDVTFTFSQDPFGHTLYLYINYSGDGNYSANPGYGGFVYINYRGLGVTSVQSEYNPSTGYMQWRGYVYGTPDVGPAIGTIYTSTAIDAGGSVGSYASVGNFYQDPLNPNTGQFATPSVHLPSNCTGIYTSMADGSTHVYGSGYYSSPYGGFTVGDTRTTSITVNSATYNSGTGYVDFDLTVVSTGTGSGTLASVNTSFGYGMQFTYNQWPIGLTRGYWQLTGNVDASGHCVVSIPAPVPERTDGQVRFGIYYPGNANYAASRTEVYVPVAAHAKRPTQILGLGAGYTPNYIQISGSVNLVTPDPNPSAYYGHSVTTSAYWYGYHQPYTNDVDVVLISAPPAAIALGTGLCITSLPAVATSGNLGATSIYSPDYFSLALSFGSYPTSDTPPGSYTFQVRFNGNAIDAPVTSAPITVVVPGLIASVGYGSPSVAYPHSPYWGPYPDQQIHFSGTVQNPHSASPPTGTATLYVDNVAVATAPLVPYYSNYSQADFGNVGPFAAGDHAYYIQAGSDQSTPSSFRTGWPVRMYPGFDCYLYAADPDNPSVQLDSGPPLYTPLYPHGIPTGTVSGHGSWYYGGYFWGGPDPVVVGGTQPLFPPRLSFLTQTSGGSMFGGGSFDCTYTPDGASQYLAGYAYYYF